MDPGAQLEAVARRVLAMPASEAHSERTIKYLREVVSKCGPNLGPEMELARIRIAMMDSMRTDLDVD
jgi:hypothetical protein